MLTNEERDQILNLYEGLYESRDMEVGSHYPIDVDLLNLICEKSISILQNDPILLELEAPINVVGDVHGQFGDCMKYIEIAGDPKDNRYLFLGDYVDRGYNSIETITALLCLKILYPENVYLLRGNHETEEISRIYGFLDECLQVYSESIWASFNEVFGYLPLAAIISEKIFCVHGGISQHLENPKEMLDVRRPINEIQDDSFISDLLWADPEPESKGYKQSERGTSYTFGPDVLERFLESNDFDLLCRAHQVVNEGFEFPFFPNQNVVTVFSAPNYCNQYGNEGAMLRISEELTCSFEFIQPPAD